MPRCKYRHYVAFATLQPVSKGATALTDGVAPGYP